jgi:hypothetical protein
MREAFLRIFRQRTHVRDGFLRAACSLVAKERHHSERIERFDRILLTFCHVQLGYNDRRIVEAYLFHVTKQRLEEWQKHMRKRLVKTLRHRVFPNRKKFQAFCEREIPESTQSWILEFTRGSIGAIEKAMLDIVSKGRIVTRVELPRGKKAVQAPLGLHRQVKCFFILRVSEDGEKISISALQRASEFDRAVRKRYSAEARNRRYDNRPATLRRCH